MADWPAGSAGEKARLFFEACSLAWEEDREALRDFKNQNWFYQSLKTYDLIDFAEVWDRIDKDFFDLFTLACEKKGTAEGVTAIIWALFGKQALVEWQGPGFDDKYTGSGWARAIVTNTNRKFQYLLAVDDGQDVRSVMIPGPYTIVLNIFTGAYDTVMTDFVRRFIPLGCHFEMSQS